jgi:Gnt-I system high-affinity gluconate transporter
MGLTLLYGGIVAIPTIILAGPLLAPFLKGISSQPLKTFQAEPKPESELPSIGNSVFTALLPVVLLVATTVLSLSVSPDDPQRPLLNFLANPSVVMLVSVAYATYSLGLRRKQTMAQLMDIYTVATKDISMILLIVAGAGALKQIFTDSGVSLVLAEGIQSWDMHPLILAWLITAVIRIAVGSATVAGLTTAGILAPLVPSFFDLTSISEIKMQLGPFFSVSHPPLWVFGLRRPTVPKSHPQHIGSRQCGAQMVGLG